MIDPIISLSFSIYSNKGVYSLLLGSGVSRSAGIPTGWEVVLDLIRRLAHLKGEECEPDPSIWYKNKFQEEPDYSKLLDEIAKSASERNQLLRGYFEPSEEDLEQSLKVPTQAHKAIAKLVVNAYIRVIVTINFDRLIEKALETTGIIPTVISTPDAVEGALPIQHTKCTIIKVHGDFPDTRIKNTPEELEKYDERITNYLNRIFDEFGLIICGWSAEWDKALYTVLERSKSHRFTTYWTTRSRPSGKTEKLINIRLAEVITIKDADTFFNELVEKISALEDYARPHPLSAKIAVTSLKKYLVDDHHRIRLHDFVMQETEKLCEQISEKNFPAPMVRKYDAEEVKTRMERYESLTEILLAIIVTGCYWGEKQHEYLWIKCLARTAYHLGSQGMGALRKLGLYPALLLLYGGGIASMVSNRYDTFSAILTEPKVKTNEIDRPLIFNIHPWELMENNLQRMVYGNKYTPISDHLSDVLREPFKELLPEDFLYQRAFDRFEYLRALVHSDLNQKLNGRTYFPIGSFGWRNIHYGDDIMNEIESEIQEDGEGWSPLKSGLFDGSLERFREIKKVVDDDIAGRGWD